MTEAAIKALEAQHQQWLREPITQQFIGWLEHEFSKRAKQTAEISTEYNEFTSDKLQRYAAQLKTIQTIKVVIYDTQTFVANIGSVPSKSL